MATVQWRPLTPSDVPALTTLFAEIEQVDQHGAHFDAAFLARFLADPRIELDRGSTAAFDGDHLVAVGILVARPEADEVHQILYEGGVHPEYRDAGLGRELMDWAARAALPLHCDHFPDKPVELVHAVDSTDETAAALLTEHGFRPARYFHKMTRGLQPDTLPPVRTPDGFDIITYRPELDEQVRVAKNDMFAEHWGVAITPPELWRTQFTGPEFQPELSPLAIDPANGDIVGLIITLEHAAETEATGKRDALFNNVGTLERARGRGVATSLLATALRAAAEHGYDSASLEVDSENPTGALGLYQKAGFTVTSTAVHYARDVTPALVGSPR